VKGWYWRSPLQGLHSLLPKSGLAVPVQHRCTVGGGGSVTSHAVLPCVTCCEADAHGWLGVPGCVQLLALIMLLHIHGLVCRQLHNGGIELVASCTQKYMSVLRRKSTPRQHLAGSAQSPWRRAGSRGWRCRSSGPDSHGLHKHCRTFYECDCARPATMHNNDNRGLHIAVSHWL
jgi:hypothetical protein